MVQIEQQKLNEKILNDIIGGENKQFLKPSSGSGTKKLKKYFNGTEKG